LLALRTWAHFFLATIKIYCANAAATHIFNTARDSDRTLQAIARNIKLLAATHYITLTFEHIPGEQNCIADLLSRWEKIHNPVAKLYTLINSQPEWIITYRNFLALNWDI
jgi:hypothetical protein